MYKNTTALSVAISLALGTAAMSPIAFAEEQQVEQLQKDESHRFTNLNY